jgi:hypothetical protein
VRSGARRNDEIIIDWHLGCAFRGMSPLQDTRTHTSDAQGPRRTPSALKKPSMNSPLDERWTHTA